MRSSLGAWAKPKARRESGQSCRVYQRKSRHFPITDIVGLYIESRKNSSYDFMDLTRCVTIEQRKADLGVKLTI